MTNLECRTSHTGDTMRYALCTTTTLTNHFAANTQHFIVCPSKVLTKVTLTPTLTPTNHR